MKPLLTEIRAGVDAPIAAQPVPYRTSDSAPAFESLTTPEGSRAFPVALEPFSCTRFEMAGFAGWARGAGIRYIGICCGGGPHHVRAMAEALGRDTRQAAIPPRSSFIQCSEQARPTMPRWAAGRRTADATRLGPAGRTAGESVYLLAVPVFSRTAAARTNRWRPERQARRRSNRRRPGRCSRPSARRSAWSGWRRTGERGSAGSS